MKVLDNRLEKKQTNCKPVGFVAKKSRRVGSPSVSMPPPYSPTWAIKASKNGMSIYIHCDAKADVFTPILQGKCQSMIMILSLMTPVMHNKLLLRYVCKYTWADAWPKHYTVLFFCLSGAHSDCSWRAIGRIDSNGALLVDKLLNMYLCVLLKRGYIDSFTFN